MAPVRVRTVVSQDLESDPEKSFSVENESPKAAELGGYPAERTKTGGWNAAPHIYALNAGDFQAGISTSINQVPYLTMTMHQSISNAARITNNYTGTCFLLTVAGGFLADSFFGAYRTIAGGVLIYILGYSLLTFSVSYADLRPPPCIPSPTSVCKPAATKYMWPLYLALYSIAVGIGAVRANNASIGADQFDDTVPAEKKQSISYYVWFFFASNVGLLITFSAGVYLQDNVSRGWGYGFNLSLLVLCSFYFFLGTSKFRSRAPAGSFITRVAQVFVAAFLKRKVKIRDVGELYDGPLFGTRKLDLSPTLSFLDRAAFIEKGEATTQVSHSRWRLCSITQVEETKRIVQMFPIWITTSAISLVFSQLQTFTVTQGSTFDRKLGPHFVVPSASLNVMFVVSSLIIVPFYDGIFVPFVRRYSKHPYGFSPLQRLGTSIAMATLMMITSALVERKRLTYVREMGYENRPLGSFILPIKMWWLLPQFFVAALVELTLFVASYQFFFYEASDSTRSIATSFTYSAAAMGYYLSSVISDIVDSTTKNAQGQSWLTGQLNDGGLEKYYWLLAAILGTDFVIFQFCAYTYTYKFDWYHLRTSPQIDSGVQRSSTASEEQGGHSVMDPQ